jgi:hypothetical protein
MQFEFSVLMVGAFKALPISELMPADVVDMEKAIDMREDLVKEATSLLKWNADQGHMPSQRFLADWYANGMGTHENRQDFDRASPYPSSPPNEIYRAGTCCENEHLRRTILTLWKNATNTNSYVAYRVVSNYCPIDTYWHEDLWPVDFPLSSSLIFRSHPPPPMAIIITTFELPNLNRHHPRLSSFVLGLRVLWSVILPGFSIFCAQTTMERSCVICISNHTAVAAPTLRPRPQQWTASTHWPHRNSFS